MSVLFAHRRRRRWRRRARRACGRGARAEAAKSANAFHAERLRARRQRWRRRRRRRRSPPRAPPPALRGRACAVEVRTAALPMEAAREILAGEVRRAAGATATAAQLMSMCRAGAARARSGYAACRRVGRARSATRAAVDAASGDSRGDAVDARGVGGGVAAAEHVERRVAARLVVAAPSQHLRGGVPPPELDQRRRRRGRGRRTSAARRRAADRRPRRRRPRSRRRQRNRLRRPWVVSSTARRCDQTRARSRPPSCCRCSHSTSGRYDSSLCPTRRRRPPPRRGGWSGAERWARWSTRSRSSRRAPPSPRSRWSCSPCAPPSDSSSSSWCSTARPCEAHAHALLTAEFPAAQRGWSGRSRARTSPSAAAAAAGAWAPPHAAIDAGRALIRQGIRRSRTARRLLHRAPRS